MRKKLLDFLACPIDKHHPLQLLEFNADDKEVVEGLLICGRCGRYYPILDEVPEMLPDGLRSEKNDLAFLKKWKSKIPMTVILGGKPWNLSEPSPAAPPAEPKKLDEPVKPGGSSQNSPTKHPSP